MRNLLLIAALFFLLLLSIISCKKSTSPTSQIEVADSSHFSITNASPAIPNLKFYLNSKLIVLPDSPVSFGKTVYISLIRNPSTYSTDTVLYPYINIPSGYQQISLGTYGSDDIYTVLNNKFEKNNNYSLFITDTIHHGQITTVLLRDDIHETDSTKSQIRFLNLSPDAPKLDIWAYPNAGYNGYKIFSSCGYLPNDFNSFLNGESFSLIDPGPYYFEATVSGTNEFVLGGLLMIPKRTVITIFSKGFLYGSGFNRIDVGVIEYRSEN